MDSAILKNPSSAEEIKSKLVESIDGIPESWDPHKSWEFIKVTLRSITWEVAGKYKRITKTEEEALIDQINRLQSNKNLLALNGALDITISNKIESSLRELNTGLEEIWVEKSKQLALKAKVKWFNEGEKSNKYFLNIINKRMKETTIKTLQNGNTVVSGQSGVENLVKEFYSDLYSEREDLDSDYDSFFPPDLPKLDQEDRNAVDKRITLTELLGTIKSCGDSAPGPDGITYKFYEFYWEILGPWAIRAWEHSLKLGTLTLSQFQRFSTK